MRYPTLLVLSAMLLLSEVALASASSPAVTRTQNTAQEKAASLRSQLSEVETKQAELQTRLKELEEDLKLGNIEQNLAGIGSTRPEDLRAQRRRQLEIERNGVQRQLDLLATSHTRLETAIAQAETEAYRQSAAPVITAPATDSTPTTAESTGAATIPARPRRAKKKKRKRSKPGVSANQILRSSPGGGEVSVLLFSIPGS